MRKFYLGALGLLVMASCSQDETVGINHDGDEITFSVVTNSATRAENVFCNNNSATNFHVSAISDGKSYIEGDDIAYQDGKWVNQDGTRYWPDESVDFYAHVNGGTTYDWSVSEGKATAKFNNFKVNQTVADQVDLMYSVKTGQTKTANSKVILNFRHALSQIVFQARNESENLHVEISGVSICKLNDTDNFTFPSTSTDNNFVDHNGEKPNTALTNQGTWANENTSKAGTASYSVTFQSVTIKAENTPLTTTDDASKNGEYNANTMLLLPQQTTAWEPKAGVGKPADQTGSYFLVKCAIYNVAGSSFDADTDVPLWGTQAAHKEVAIPVAANWDQGKKYIYTFVFGNGNGGYEPDPDPEDPDPDPEPVLVPITFDITIDDFVTVDPDIEIETGVPGAGE